MAAEWTALENFAFTELYRKRLAPLVGEWRRRRLAARRRTLWFAAGTALAILFLAYTAGLNPISLLGGMFLAGAGYFFCRVAVLDPFRQQYKSEFVRAVAESFGLRYAANDHVTEWVFRGSGLFQGQPFNRYGGEDRFHGAVGQTDLEFSELTVKHVTGSGKNKSTKIVFSGLFISADFHKHFHGRTWVLPDAAEGLLGPFGQTLQGLNPFRPGELVKMENAEFERAFAVYAEDPLEARYLLTPLLMERLVAYRRRTGATVRASFSGSRVYLALSGLPDLFEPHLWRDPDGEEECRRLYEQVRFGASVVEALDLNTRVWTKE